jgi:hypothetical protein
MPGENIVSAQCFILLFAEVKQNNGVKPAVQMWIGMALGFASGF